MVYLCSPMCTVTFLPVGNSEFILTSNRDEQISREHALPVQQYMHHGIETFYPRDGRAHGTWIASGRNKITLCLLNGAFEKHEFGQSYRMSRGLVLLDFFKYNDAMSYANQYNFFGIEPFTLVIVNGSMLHLSLHEMRWDGQHVHLKQLDPLQPYIWSSVTLYSPTVIMQREKWFEQWVEKQQLFDTASILSFHHFGGQGDQHSDLLMQRNLVRTVSITCVHHQTMCTEIIYEDVQSQTLQRNVVWSAA